MKVKDYLGKQISFTNPDTDEEQVGVVTAIEDDGALEIDGEFVAFPEDVELVESVEEEIIEEAEKLTVDHVRSIEDKGVLKAILKEHELKPKNLNTYKTVENLQDFIIEALQLDEVPAEEKPVTKKTTPKKETKTEPEKKPEKEKPASKPKSTKKGEGKTWYICDLILEGDTDISSITKKVIKKFTDADEKKTRSTVSAYLSVARQFKLIK